MRYMFVNQVFAIGYKDIRFATQPLKSFGFKRCVYIVPVNTANIWSRSAPAEVTTNERNVSTTDSNTRVNGISYTRRYGVYGCFMDSWLCATNCE